MLDDMQYESPLRFYFSEESQTKRLSHGLKDETYNTFNKIHQFPNISCPTLITTILPSWVSVLIRRESYLCHLYYGNGYIFGTFSELTLSCRVDGPKINYSSTFLLCKIFTARKETVRPVNDIPGTHDSCLSLLTICI